MTGHTRFSFRSACLVAALLALAPAEAAADAPGDAGEPAATAARYDSVKGRSDAASPRTAYILSPSAFLAKRGEGTVSLKMLMIGTAEYGLHDHVNLGIDFVLPGLIPGIKATVGASPAEHVHLAAGFRSFAVLATVDPMGSDHDPFLVHVPYVVATVGTPDLNVSASGGVFLFEETHGSAFRNFHTISGLVRLSPGVALTLESWYVREPPRIGNPIPLVGLRWTPGSGSGTWDFGLLFIDPDALGYRIPLPWVAFSRAF
jgi:hypothetical protein